MGITRINNQALTNVTSAGLPTLDHDKLPSGTVLQTVHKQSLTTSSLTSDSGGNQISALSTNITPKSSSSKFLITVTICGEFSNSGQPYNSMFSISRTIGGTHTELVASSTGNRTAGIMTPTISFQVNASSTMEAASYQYVDSPNTTSQITYAPRVKSNTSNTFYLNRTVSDTNNADYERGTSTIVIQEIAG